MYSPTYPSSFETFAELSQGKTLILSSDGLIRLNADGSFDPTFGDAGRALIGGGNCYLVDFAVTDDNKIVVNKNCSRSLQPSGTRFLGQIHRYWSDGTPDIRFGQGGKTTIKLGDSDIFLGRIETFQSKYLIVTGTQGLPGPSALPVTARFFGTGNL